MIGRSGSYLGVAISERAVTCAELTSSGDRCAVRRTATFVFPDELSFETPDAAGQALAAFLRQKKFSTTRAVVGVPARWLVAVEKDVPPADEDQARAALRLQAERLAVAEHGEVVFDFAGTPRRAEPTRVLLVGMLRLRLENVERLMDAAGMSVIAITSTGLALAAATSVQSGDGGVLSLLHGGGELVWRAAGSPRMLRHIPVSLNGRGLPPTASLGGELRRMVATAPTNGSAQSRSLLLLDGIGLEPQQINELSERLGVAVKPGNSAEVLDLDAQPAGADLEPGEALPAGRFAPAMALALTGARPDLLPLDFKHSRLTPPKPQRVSRAMVYGASLGALLLIGIITLYVMVSRRESKLAGIQSELKKSDDGVKVAKASSNRWNFGRGFFDSRPQVLDAMREVTQTFHDDEKLWATVFNLRENGRGTLTGKSGDQKTALALLGRLQKNKRFGEVKIPDLRQADTRSGEWSFTISFVFNKE